MPEKRENSKAYSLVGFNKNIQIEGLHLFAKNIEKDFFSQVTLRNISKTEDDIKLVIELTCNLNLSEMLTHFKKEIWGNFTSSNNSFKEQFKRLKDCNTVAIEIEELCILLTDTTIVINSLYNESIALELENIMHEMYKSFLKFTKDQREIPYEIFVSVYEENELVRLPFKRAALNYNFAQDYYTFWGLYFDSEDDAMVYDLKNETLIYSSLQMHNR